jgi:cell wall-associated NlpC family hydrolase
MTTTIADFHREMARRAADLPPRWVAVLMAELSRWGGTPYVPGQGAPQMGADCIGFGAAVYDHLYGFGPDAPPLPRHAWDVAFHNGREAAKTTAQIRRRWPGVVQVWRRGERKLGRPLTADMLEPGDALIVAVSGGAPGHMMIVGGRPHTLFHCDPNAGVCYTGSGQYLRRVVRVWRSAVRESWADTWKP